MISVHTSPLEQPGTGDAGGLNVYVAETAKELAARGVEVDIFTRRTTGETPVEADLVPLPQLVSQVVHRSPPSSRTTSPRDHRMMVKPPSGRATTVASPQTGTPPSTRPFRSVGRPDRSKTCHARSPPFFHPVPSDEVRNWKQYDEYYSRFFGQSEKDKENKKPSLYKWGHVVAENFAQGEQGVQEVKEVLSTIRCNLVEMPLLFLKEEDIAKEGVGLNAITEEIYT